MFPKIEMKWRFLGPAILAPVMLFTGFSFLPIADELEVRVPLQADFVVRHLLRMETPLHHKIKIFAFDDDSARAFNRSSPKLATWNSILTQIASYRPRAVMIDKLFDMPEQNADFESFVKEVSALPTKIVIGAFSTERQIRGRKPLDLSRPWGRLEHFIHDGTKLEDFDAKYPWLQEKPSFPYGAPPELIDAFAAIAHITYHGYFLPPILRFPEGGVLPHWSFYATGGPSLRDGKLFINDLPVPLDKTGRIVVNFLHEDEFKDIIFSMKHFADEKGGKQENGPSAYPLQEDDVILVLPGMYTGHADWVQSPMGEIPGGLLLASLVNSGLQKVWLKTLKNRPALVLFASLAGAFLGALSLSAVAYWGCLGLFILGIFVAGMAAFSIGYYVTPWFSVAVSAFLSASCVYALRIRSVEREHFRLKQEFATARLVQNQLFPPADEKFGTLRVIAKYEPAAECGGDFWNHFELPDGRQYIVIGDAVGHGIPAALVAVSALSTSMSISDIFRNADPNTISPAFVLSHLNDVLVTSFRKEITMTAFVAECDLAGGRLRFSNAGHCNPFLVEKAAETGAPKMQLLKSRGDPLGLDLKTAYSDAQTPFPKGSRLHLYTDGMVECRDQEGKILGNKKFMEFFKKSITKDAPTAIKEIYELVHDYTKSATLEDDGTIVIVES